MRHDGRADNKDRLIGTQSFSVLGISTAFLIFVAIAVPQISGNGTSVANRLATGALFGVLSGFTVAAVSARAFVRADQVHMVSFLVTYRIPISEIVDLEDDNGFFIKVQSGRRIGSAAFGTSPIATMTGNRRGRRAARRLRAIMGQLSAQRYAWSQDSVQARPRWMVLGLACTLVALAMIWAIA